MNAAKISNFFSNAKEVFAVVEVYKNRFGETAYNTFSSGRTREEAIQKFYERFMYRTYFAEREIMVKAQRHGRINLYFEANNHRELIEHNMQLIA